MKRLLDRFERLRAIEKATRKRLSDEGANYWGPYDMFKRVRAEAEESSPEYEHLRIQFAKMITRANEISGRVGVSYYMKGRSAQLEGGSPFEGSVYALVLDRPSDMLDLDTSFRDTANQVIGALEREVDAERRKLFNPLHWVRSSLTFLIRLPYELIRLSGFDVEIVQEHLIGRAIQLVFAIAWILLLTWLGFRSVSDIIDLLSLVLK